LGLQQMMMMMMRMMKTLHFVIQTKLNDDDDKDGLSCAWTVKIHVHATIYFSNIQN
jgi:hypothetical protein